MLSFPYYLPFIRMVFFLWDLLLDSLFHNHQRRYFFSVYSESFCHHPASVKFSSNPKILLYVQPHWVLFTLTGVVLPCSFVVYGLLLFCLFVCKYAEAYASCRDHPLFLSSIGLQIICSVTEDIWHLDKLSFLPSPSVFSTTTYYIKLFCMN